MFNTGHKDFFLRAPHVVPDFFLETNGRTGPVSRSNDLYSLSSGRYFHFSTRVSEPVRKMFRNNFAGRRLFRFRPCRLLPQCVMYNTSVAEFRDMAKPYLIYRSPGYSQSWPTGGPAALVSRVIKCRFRGAHAFSAPLSFLKIVNHFRSLFQRSYSTQVDSSSNVIDFQTCPFIRQVLRKYS